MEQLLSGVRSTLPPKSKYALEVQQLQTQADRRVKYVIFVQHWECWCYSSISWVEDSTARRNIGKKVFGREEQKRGQEDGRWAVVLFSEGKDTCVCTEQVDSRFANSSFSAFFSNSTVRAQLYIHRCKFTGRDGSTEGDFCSSETIAVKRYLSLCYQCFLQGGASTARGLLDGQRPRSLLLGAKWKERVWEVASKLCSWNNT